jgi:hypothetical protein
MDALYKWQVTKGLQLPPAKDLSDEEFEEYLEQLIQQREGLYGEAA